MAINLHNLCNRENWSARLNSAREWFSGLSPSTRRYLFLGAIFAGFFLLFWHGMPQKKPRAADNSKSRYDFVQPDMAGEVMAEKLQHSISQMERRLGELQSRLDKMDKRQTDALNIVAMPQSTSKKPTDKNLLEELGKSMNQGAVVEGGGIYASGAAKLDVPPRQDDKGQPIAAGKKAAADMEKAKAQDNGVSEPQKPVVP